MKVLSNKERVEVAQGLKALVDLNRIPGDELKHIFKWAIASMLNLIIVVLWMVVGTICAIVGYFHTWKVVIIWVLLTLILNLVSNHFYAIGRFYLNKYSKP